VKLTPFTPDWVTTAGTAEPLEAKLPATVPVLFQVLSGPSGNAVASRLTNTAAWVGCAAKPAENSRGQRRAAHGESGGRQGMMALHEIGESSGFLEGTE
jgi:hypothetical protein